MQRSPTAAAPASTEKHTPGPWSVETLKTSVGHCHKVTPVNACIYVDHRDMREQDEKTLTAAANAHLIAAAPELYGASKPRLSVTARDLLETTAEAEREVGDKQVAVAIEFLLARYDAQQRAIAKAEGRS